ncbi:MAG: methyltransferase domain-containing protein [Actinomycetota bacterium]|nr:MAG: methyltransferase domain-containing protein [Actinomycetota bacterium]
MTPENTAASGREKTWEPAIYNQFSSQREEPFWDLANLLEPAEGARLADLGCGDGRLTAALHSYLRAGNTLGIDSAPGMLAGTAAFANQSVEFARGDIAEWSAPGSFDIIFANASLQWVADHPRVISSLKESLAPGGQLAIQVPSNADHVIYRLASQLGSEWFGDNSPVDTVALNVKKPEEYSELLESLGFARHHVRLVVYGHRLSSASQTVDWVKGTTLNRFKAILDDAEYENFLQEYHRRVIKELDDQSPYFFTFKRILMWARLP